MTFVIKFTNNITTLVWCMLVRDRRVKHEQTWMVMNDLTCDNAKDIYRSNFQLYKCALLHWVSCSAVIGAWHEHGSDVCASVTDRSNCLFCLSLTFRYDWYHGTNIRWKRNLISGFMNFGYWVEFSSTVNNTPNPSNQIIEFNFDEYQPFLGLCGSLSTNV